MSISSSSPAELARRAAAGEPAAVAEIEALLARHRGGVLALCGKIVGDPQRAEELAQDTLAVAWQNLSGYRGEGTFSGWLAGIARNHCMNAVRKRKDLLTEDGVLEPGDPAASALASMQVAEREEILRLATQMLEPLEQEVLHLRYVEGLPVQTITRVLALEGESGARGVLQRCRRKLLVSLRAVLDERGLGSSFIRDSP
ncbi:MAG: sigma-70 family RNA polymerase sigma factor [Pseudomonadota bacterium]|nr:sigma-70 family RNA polymerase sigma factor [Pseudomonadota bacterium]